MIGRGALDATEHLLLVRRMKFAQLRHASVAIVSRTSELSPGFLLLLAGRMEAHEAFLMVTTTAQFDAARHQFSTGSLAEGARRIDSWITTVANQLGHFGILFQACGMISCAALVAREQTPVARPAAFANFNPHFRTLLLFLPFLLVLFEDLVGLDFLLKEYGDFLFALFGLFHRFRGFGLIC